MHSESFFDQLAPATLQQISVVGEHTSRIRDLLGFRKGHQVPNEISERTSNFVSRLASAEINDELESRFTEFRTHMRLRRTQLTVSDSENGIGQIQTPWFSYQIAATQHNNDAAMVQWRRILCDFKVPQKIVSAEMTAVFGNSFDRVEFLPAQPLEIASLIDHIEDQDDATISLDYDRHATWCRISMSGERSVMHLTPGCVAFIATQPTAPGRLLQAFCQLQTHMARSGVNLLD